MNVLFISHRMPYPPNKGDKIRAFNELKHLSKNNDIFLFTHIDEKDDLQYISQLRQYCKEINVVSITPLIKKILSFPYLLSKYPLSIPYFYSSKLNSLIEKTLKGNHIDLIFCYSSSMAEYVFKQKKNVIKNTPKIMDFVDLDSDKWLQYADNRRGPMSWVFKREGLSLLEYERKIGKFFDYSLFVSDKECQDFLRYIDLPNICSVRNGVDVEFFSPETEYPNVYDDSCRHLVFTGAMDYHANVDAVCWFAKEIFPWVYEKTSNVKFIIAGSNPVKEVRQLESERIQVTGRVLDIRPYIYHADIVVVPLRLARGIQNKVLEGMSMGRPVVVTPQALSGIEAEHNSDLLIADSEEEFSAGINSILSDKLLSKELGERGRLKVQKLYSWGSAMSKLDEIISTVKH